ncbi:MAG: YhjD/YihY/BrkB family envelope integrity protein, partial [Candidatus Omnitrophica bacterium]|nr:YhjD/YihY/BrkB family envelope integrity protein [Candidatus Omnitrophota bacterium]
SGIMGGIIAGTIYQLVQYFYIIFQIGVANSNAIYGSFAALPLFLLWLQLSWRIVLFGTEISFAHQNVDTYEFEHDCLNASYAFKKRISLEITCVLAKRFAAGQKPLTGGQIADALEIPIRLVQDVMFNLVECGIVSEIREPDYKQLSYQPARDINTLTIQYVSDVLDDRGTMDIPVGDTEELKRISESLKFFSDLTRKSPANRLLKDM